MSYSYKRKRRDTLTGGTNDVNPQYMTLSVTQSAADTYTQVSQQIPIQRLATMGRAQVMEVLKVFFQSSDINVQSTAATIRRYNVSLSTKSLASAPNLSEPTVFALYNKSNLNAFTATGTGMLAQEFEPFIFDSSDGAGHGFLVASDNIYLQIDTLNTGVVNSAQVKILYRWKDVSVQEYVGIVQSQS